MTNAQHTPGPWRAVVRSNQAGPRSVAVSLETGQGGAWELVRVRTLTQQNVADARLIAASPRLLAALRQTLTAWAAAKAGDIAATEWMNAAETEARAAIAQAEGRS